MPFGQLAGRFSRDGFSFECHELQPPATRLPAAKITEIKTFTPTASAKAKAKEKVVA